MLTLALAGAVAISASAEPALADSTAADASGVSPSRAGQLINVREALWNLETPLTKEQRAQIGAIMTSYAQPQLSRSVGEPNAQAAAVTAPPASATATDAAEAAPAAAPVAATPVQTASAAKTNLSPVSPVMKTNDLEARVAAVLDPAQDTQFYQQLQGGEGKQVGSFGQ